MPESPPPTPVPSPEPPLPPPGVMTLVEDIFENDALPVLEEYTRIPCLSPDFDPEWSAHGHIQRAAELLRVWSAARPIRGLSVELLELPGLTPVIVAEIPATSAASAGPATRRRTRQARQPAPATRRRTRQAPMPAPETTRSRCSTAISTSSHPR